MTSRKAVEHLVPVIKPATLKALMEQTRDGQVGTQEGLPRVRWLPERNGYHTQRALSCGGKQGSGDSGMKNTGKSSDAGSRSSGHNFGGSAYGGASNKASDLDRTKSGQWKVVGLDGHWKSVCPRAAALPQHKEVCGREAQSVRLFSH
jgi:hypothetical protein